MSEKAIVFGGAGFIGSHLLGKLRSEYPEKELISVDIRDPKIRVDGVDYVKHDIRDLSTFEVGGRIERIYNLAAVHTTPGHPTHEYYETNIRGATEVTAFARRNDVKSILFTSSISVYGPSEQTKTEDIPPAPESAYGWSKFLAEGIHRAWLAEAEDRRLVICRPAVIFGYREGGNFTRMARLLEKGFFLYPGRKDTIKACFYVEDLVESFDEALKLDQRYVLYNGSYPDRYTIEEIVEQLRTMYFPKARTFLLPRAVVMATAFALRPFSAMGLGLHPDRVTKLVKSTDVVPGWLTERGLARSGRLAHAFERWARDSQGKFD